MITLELLKRGEILKGQWRNRYCVIKGDCLIYYKKKDHIESGKIQNIVYLPGATYQRVPYSKVNNEFFFHMDMFTCVSCLCTASIFSSVPRSFVS